MNDAPIVVVHIPKTAGTTFSAVLRRNFPDGEYFLPKIFRLADRLDERLRQYDEQRPERVRFLRGHVPLTVRDRLPPGLRYVTILREPVARTWSHYWHVHTKARAEGREPSLVDGLTHPYLPDNLQARMLCGLPDPLTRPADTVLQEAALRELRALEFVGLVERFPESMLLAQDRLRLQHVAYRRVNVRGTPMPPEHREALLAHNAIDLVLYDEAVARLDEELASVSLRRTRALEHAANSLTRRRPPVGPMAAGYVLDYMLTGARLAYRERGGRLKSLARWRRWRAVRAVRAGLRFRRAAR